MQRLQIRDVVRLSVGFLAMLALLPVVEGQVVHYACHPNQNLQPVVPKNLDHMGHSLAIGDFNHDGIRDIVMGGYDRLNNGYTPEPKTRVFVFLGTGGSPPFRHRVTLLSSATDSLTFDLFGFAVAFIGSVDDDLCDDLVVGSPLYGSTDAGRVSIFRGIDGLSPTASGVIELNDADDEYLSINGSIYNGWFGASLATAKDSSGNLLKDLLIGAPGILPVTMSSITGSVYLYQTSTMVDAGTLAGGTPGIAIAAGTSAATPGISGSPTTGYTVTAHRLLDGLHGGDCFGQSVAFVGNVDGQVGQEFLVGAPQWAAESGSTETSGPGYVQLFRMGSSVALITIYGDQGPSDSPRQEGEAFGFSVVGGIDLDIQPDSVPDLVVGAPLFNSEATGPGSGNLKAGRVRIFSGADAALGVKTAILDDAPGPNGTKLFSESGSEWFGYSVAVLPDIDGDLWPEILVGAQQAAIASATECIPPHTDPPPRTGEGGYAALYTSGVGTLGGVTPGVRLATFYGEAFKDHMGRAVAADDLYGTSGRPEIVLSVPGWTPFGQTDPADVGHGCVWDGDAVLQ